MSWTIEQVMTPAADLVTLRPETGYKEVARLLQEHDISALPVVEGAGSRHRLVGIVSEADLIVKEEGADSHQRRAIRARGDEAKARAVTAADLMTAPVVTVRPAASLAAAAHTMHRHRVRRLPVVDDDGWLAGIVSQRDLVKVFLRSDESIEREVREDVLRHALGLETDAVAVSVDEGVVTLEGDLATAAIAQLLVKLVEQIEGVVDVRDQMSRRPDETATVV
jgi:CBS-domain-containing membrane protein